MPALLWEMKDRVGCALPSISLFFLRNDPRWTSRSTFRTRAAPFLAAAFLLLADAAPAQDAPLRRLYAQAQAAQQAGDFQSAATYYEKLVLLRPDLAEAHANLGSIYYQTHDDKKAVAALEKAVRLKPELAAPHFFLGVVTSRQRRYEKAIRHLTTSARLDPTQLVIPFYLGEACFAAGRYLEAVSALEKAASLTDFSADAYYYLSKAYGKLSKRALDRLSQEYPGSFYLQLARGHFHEGRREWTKAQEAYQRARKARPAAAGLEARLQWVSRNAADEDAIGPPPGLPEGETTILGLLYNSPSAREIGPLILASRKRIQRGASLPQGEEQIYRSAEDYQIASYLAARWIGENDPGSYRAHQLSAQLHESRGEADDAVREYRAALRLKPELQDVHFAIGTLFWSQSRFHEALPELRAELRINPHHAEANYVIADILQVRGRQGEAKKHLLECLRLQPDLPEAHLAIERIYFAEGQFDQALAHMKTLARLSPSNPTPHYRMSMIYRRLGHAGEARKELEEFQRLQASRVVDHP